MASSRFRPKIRHSVEPTKGRFARGEMVADPLARRKMQQIPAAHDRVHFFGGADVIRQNRDTECGEDGDRGNPYQLTSSEAHTALKEGLGVMFLPCGLGASRQFLVYQSIVFALNYQPAGQNIRSMDKTADETLEEIKR